MEKGLLNLLIKRGYVEQVTNIDLLAKRFDEEKITFYVGIDPTADSLHIGHFMVLMVSSIMQKYGHRPIILIGGGTARIGDPSDRTDMRKMLTEEELENNVRAIKEQVSKFISFEGENKAILVDNNDWISELSYLGFMKDIGIHFNINTMLRAECYKRRLEDGLTFFELGYMLLQANDYKHLFEKYNCSLQIGGNDQWSNILAGTELIRKIHAKDVDAFTLKLLTKKDGTKMGKTAGGALWLSAKKTSPFEFYQYWRNVEDEMVVQIAKVLTYMTEEEIDKLEETTLKDINLAKKMIAFEITKIIHGEDEAKKAEEASVSLFEKGNVLDLGSLEEKEFSRNTSLLEIVLEFGFADSNGNAKKLIQNGAISINGEKILDPKFEVNEEIFDENKNIILKKGKNNFRKIVLKD